MNSEEHKFNFSKREEEILEFWKKNKIFEKSVEQRKRKKEFIFYEGPPYANGRPGIHHVEARAFKDIILRYKTMRGFCVPRRAGWDTHGLPTEIEVEKKLNIKSKKDIEEKIGIEKFIEEARENVFLYKEEWEKLTERMAYWLDMKNAYATMTNDYIETLWWIFKEIDRRKLLYEDYKIVPWCPRCQTALSSHEVSLGYRKIKEESITIKFELIDEPGTYILAWTTTPWTLPGNVALAVHPEIEYVKFSLKNYPGISDGVYIVSKKDFSDYREAIEENKSEGAIAEIIEQIKSKDLIGKKYKPLYQNNAPYVIIGGNFVSAEEGTGVVHIAPAFGEDDMRVGKENNLPILVTVTEEGKMLMPGYRWNGLFIKDADKLIIEGLRKRDLIFNAEPYEHDYPFCWRCDSPLMYYAKTSWWLKTTAVKRKMISENKKIHWYPEYLKNGRFGEWLNELRDWAISRERYWGTPLPIWRCENCNDYKVVGSLEELKKDAVKSGNKYFAMRHGWAESNRQNVSNADVNTEYKLTPRGKKEILKTAKTLNPPSANRRSGQKIDLIFASDFLRTKETALLVAKTLGIPEKDVIFDKRLREINTGIFNGKSDDEYHAYFSSLLEKFTKTPPNGENLTELKNRTNQFLYELEGKYKNRNILIVSHEYPIWMLVAGAKGMTNEEAVAIKKKDDFVKTAEVVKLDFMPLPHDKNFVLDLHRPHIDEIFLKCEKCRGKMERIKGVADVWFDSGSMPLAQNHFPFSMPKNKLPYPADYICEAIDQTRGWFYTLLAVATLLGRKAPYKNVLSLGLVLDEKGQKMSKSRGNVVVPKELMDKYGADAVRWYFYTINQPWDEKLFKEEDIAAVLRRFILIFWNCFAFWKTYRNKNLTKLNFVRLNLLINKWLIAKFNEIISHATKFLDNYDVVSASRLIEEFIVEDISHWYIRRIREKMKNPNSKEAKETASVLGYVLINTAKLLAPFTPFISEEIYREAGGKKKSVHLEDWSAIKSLATKDKQLLKKMNEVRNVISQVLEARAKAGIKVRQPLSVLSTSSAVVKEKWAVELIAGEANFKKIVFDKNLKEIKIDTTITEEMKEEGMLRDLIRQMQDIRKKEGLKPNQMVEFYIATDSVGRNFIVKYAKELKKSVSAKSLIVRSTLEGGYEIKIGEFNFKVKL